MRLRLGGRLLTIEVSEGPIRYSRDQTVIGRVIDCYNSFIMRRAVIILELCHVTGLLANIVITR